MAKVCLFGAFIIVFVSVMNILYYILDAIESQNLYPITHKDYLVPFPAYPGVLSTNADMKEGSG